MALFARLPELKQLCSCVNGKPSLGHYEHVNDGKPYSPCDAMIFRCMQQISSLDWPVAYGREQAGSQLECIWRR